MYNVYCVNMWWFSSLRYRHRWAWPLTCHYPDDDLAEAYTGTYTRFNIITPQGYGVRFLVTKHTNIPKALRACARPNQSQQNSTRTWPLQSTSKEVQHKKHRQTTYHKGVKQSTRFIPMLHSYIGTFYNLRYEGIISIEGIIIREICIPVKTVLCLRCGTCRSRNTVRSLDRTQFGLG